MNREQKHHFIMTGMQMGYPSCCIRMFVMVPLAADRNWPNPWEGTGYIPCPHCAVKPMMTVQGLINSNRDPALPPFPSKEV